MCLLGGPKTAGFCTEWIEWWSNRPRKGPQLPENLYTTCKSGGYLPVSGGQLALVMAELTTTNHCGQNNETVSCGIFALEKDASAFYARRKGGVSIHFACASGASTSVNRQWHRLNTADPHSGLITLACLPLHFLYYFGFQLAKAKSHKATFCYNPTLTATIIEDQSDCRTA